MSQRERNVRLEVVLITNTCFFQLLNAQHSLPSEISGCFSNVVARLERRWLLRLLCVGRKSVGCVGWLGGTPRPGLPGTPGLPGCRGWMCTGGSHRSDGTRCSGEGSSPAEGCRGIWEEERNLHLTRGGAGGGTWSWSLPGSAEARKRYFWVGSVLLHGGGGCRPSLLLWGMSSCGEGQKAQSASG